MYETLIQTPSSLALLITTCHPKRVPNLRKQYIIVEPGIRAAARRTAAPEATEAMAEVASRAGMDLEILPSTAKTMIVCSFLHVCMFHIGL